LSVTSINTTCKKCELSHTLPSSFYSPTTPNVKVIADFRLTMRMIETSATTFVDGGMSCISGRTAIYRTEILTDPKFQHEFQNETWLGKYGLHSGDDKFITRWLVKNQWNMRMQNHKDCCLQTTFKNDVSWKDLPALQTSVVEVFFYGCSQIMFELHSQTS
jgi:hypothetical protein